MNTRMSRIPSVLLLLIGVHQLLHSQYQPTILPEKWKFKESTRAFSVNDSSEEVTIFRRNVEVDILNQNLSDRTWTVYYDPIHQAPIEANIKIPDLSEIYVASFSSASRVIHGFPLLKYLLESPEEWENRLRLLVNSANNLDINSFWEHEAISTEIDSRSYGEIIKIEMWNQKKSGVSKSNPSQLKSFLAEKLSRLERLFHMDATSFKNRSMHQIKAIREDSALFVLPNQIVANLRYNPKENLVLEFAHYPDLKRLAALPPDPYEIADRLRKKKFTPSGHLYLAEIPFPNRQRRESIFARVMAYYGHEVDSHLLNDLIASEALYLESRGEEEQLKNIIDANRRFCAGTPFRLRQIGRHSEDQFADIQNAVENGIPVIWLISGQIRLIIGFHPENHEIVYSGSRDAGNEVKTMTFSEYQKINRQMWILDPQSH
ncbi:MAG: C39 family peptidase [Opitutales bacterium]|nr:C39 family peptidase [Opitutales bacterium]